MHGLPRSALILVGALAVACTAPPTEDSPSAMQGAAVADDSAQAEASLRTTFDEMIAAYEGEDAATLERLYADDVVLIPPGEAVLSDRAAVVEGLATLADIDYSIEAQIRDLQISGDLAVMFVAYTDQMTPRDGGDAESSDGRWVIVWNRGADGQWRISREIWNLAPEQPDGG
ncbi:MAG: nuclear transport factor 2 family protein [Gemmatimonadota bacterium]|jgi:uncharacterized protein (TIGR02246 family)